jgi:hypothetical protein
MTTRTRAQIRYTLRMSVRGSEDCDPPHVAKEAIALNLALESSMHCVGIRLVGESVLPREEVRSSQPTIRFRALPRARKRKKT